MIDIEKKARQKKHSDVINAGRGAYRMLIPVNGNPHSKQPFRDLWDKGWRLERRAEDAKRFPGKRPPFKQVGAPGFNKSRYPGQYVKRSPTLSAFAGVTNTLHPAVITERLVDRFNRRHQTRA